MALYCIVFDIIAVYCMSPHCILWYGMVLYFIWSYCTVSHCYVPLLQRAGELPRSASSHFERRKFEFHIGQLGLPTRLILITPIARDIASPRFIFIPHPPFLSKLTNIKATIINSVRSSLRYDSPLCGTLNYPQNSEALVLTF